MARPSSSGIPGVSVTLRDGRLLVRVQVSGQDRYLQKTFSPPKDGSAKLTKEASLWVGEAKRKVAEGHEPGRLSFAAFAEDYSRVTEARGKGAYMLEILQKMVPAMRAAGLDDMRPKDWGDRVYEWLGGLQVGWADIDGTRTNHRLVRGPLRPATRNAYLSRIRAVIHYALARRRLLFDPLIGIEDFDEGDWLKATFTIAELRTMVAADADPFWLAACLLIYTGARISEVMGMRWEWVDWDAGVIRVQYQADAEERERHHLKTGERFVPMMRELRDVLRSRRKAAGFIVEDAPVKSRRGRASRIRYDHKPERRCEVYDRFVERLGIERGRRTTHSFRHTFISMRLAQGDSFHLIMDAVGHSSERTTLDYGKMRAAYATAVKGWPAGEFCLRAAPPEAELPIVLADEDGPESFTLDLKAMAQAAAARVFGSRPPAAETAAPGG